MGGTCGTARLWKKRNAGRNLVKKPEGKSPLEIPGRRGEVNIKIDLKNRCDGKALTVFIWFRTRASGGLFGHGNRDWLLQNARNFVTS
jgi:hypothetical protein